MISTVDNMKDDFPLINSHNSWNRLREVWLGDVYPSSWYDHLEPEIRDVFYRLTEITKQDLDVIQDTLQNLGVCVRRPTYDSIDNYLGAEDNLIKPQICPRDHFVVIGNDLIGHKWQTRAWQSIIDGYLTDAESQFVASSQACINGANVVRVGRDIIVDRNKSQYVYNGEWPRYRVRVVDNGGHMDGCFAVLRPGLIIANRYYQDYDKTFPGWEKIMLHLPTYHDRSIKVNREFPSHNGKFWDTTIGATRRFNEHIIKHALDWVGCYTETYFEVNCLVIDECNVVMLSKNSTIEKELNKHGINVHWVPFRARSFWDGAMHCLTVDIHRESKIEDFFPERDGVKSIIDLTN
jgi:hypothetical protein